MQHGQTVLRGEKEDGVFLESERIARARRHGWGWGMCKWVLNADTVIMARERGNCFVSRSSH